MLTQISIWLLFVAFAFPLSLVAWSSRRAAIDLAARPVGEAEVISRGEVVYDQHGSRTRSITVSMPAKVSARVVHSFGPIVISANGRAWAANAVLVGLMLVFLGLLGLLHFPSSSKHRLGLDSTQVDSDKGP